MRVIEPKLPSSPKWDYGDILQSGEDMFILVKTSVEGPALINLDTGIMWYSGYTTELHKLKDILKRDYPSLKHYSKSQYRMYLEAP